jgi:hypothetical protein
MSDLCGMTRTRAEGLRGSLFYDFCDSHSLMGALQGEA